jgi:hypothetical protein
VHENSVELNDEGSRQVIVSIPIPENATRVIVIFETTKGGEPSFEANDGIRRDNEIDTRSEFEWGSTLRFAGKIGTKLRAQVIVLLKKLQDFQTVYLVLHAKNACGFW